MEKLAREDLYSLEQYAQLRNEFRARVMAHKKNRRLALGPHLNLYFEDRLTMQYQVQEMLRIERIFEAEAIEEELEAYNPLIPDGRNWKATMMLEYGDVEERREALSALVGIETLVYVEVDGFSRSYAIADEDLERSDDDKTSSVHFLRFEFEEDAVAAARTGAAVRVGVEHPGYRFELDDLEPAQKEALLADLD